MEPLRAWTQRLEPLRSWEASRIRQPLQALKQRLEPLRSWELSRIRQSVQAWKLSHPNHPLRAHAAIRLGAWEARRGSPDAARLAFAIAQGHARKTASHAISVRLLIRLYKAQREAGMPKHAQRTLQEAKERARLIADKRPQSLAQAEISASERNSRIADWLLHPGSIPQDD